MGDATININLADTLPYLEERFLSIFGKDPSSVQAAAWFKSLQATAAKQASVVHCIGMHSPIPFGGIYQPTRLKINAQPQTIREAESIPYQDKTARSIIQAEMTAEQSIRAEQLLRGGTDAIILAGPGWGKTTFLHHIFRCLVEERTTLPVLITLRRPTAVEDLEKFVDTASRIKKKQHRSNIMLLLDGYDELPIQQRRTVSDVILRFQGLEIGNFFVTCRDYYDIPQITAYEVRIDGFSLQNKYAFVKAFLSAFRSSLNPIEIVDDFEARGFSEFLSHPLLLTLACIAKTSPSTVQPRSAIRLLERALDVLCYRWDDQKEIERERLTSLDGKDRIQILKKLAYIAKTPYLSQQRAEGIASAQINRMTIEKVDPHQALLEIARFYGIMVPSDEGYEFVHRTIQDFLAAQYWVETGEFARITQYEWNSRTAYAACRLEDATTILESALRSPDGTPTIAEILSNSPSFDMKRIANAIAQYFAAPGRVQHLDKSNPNRISGRLETDFVRLTSNRFLIFMVEHYSSARMAVNDIIVGYCLIELLTRKQRLDFTSYKAAIVAYGSDRFAFDLIGVGQLQLGSLNPGQ